MINLAGAVPFLGKFGAAPLPDRASADILDAIAGALRSDEGTAEPEAMQREDGSWLLAGSMPADEMADQLGIALPERRDYETVAGPVIGELRHLPSTGEAVETLGWLFEVVDLAGVGSTRSWRARLRPMRQADLAQPHQFLPA